MKQHHPSPALSAELESDFPVSSDLFEPNQTYYPDKGIKKGKNKKRPFTALNGLKFMKIKGLNPNRKVIGPVQSLLYTTNIS